MDEQEIINLARPLYNDHGPNQWPHVQRVVAQAKDAATRTGTKLRSQDLAALYLHDAAKGRMNEYPGISDHGVASAILARKILTGKLKDRLVSAVAAAIAEHNLDVKPRSRISDILMSGDANKPELDWVIRKSYIKSRDVFGRSGEDLINNVLNRARSKPVVSGRRHIPSLYSRAFAAEIERMREQASALTRSNIESRIAKALKKYEKEDPHA